LRLALGDGGVARGEEDVLGALEPPPQRLVGLARRAAGGLPLAEQLAEDGGGAGPVGGVGEFLGPHAQLFLARLGGGALTVEFGEVRAAPAVERLARLGVALPQRVVDLAVDPADGLPLLEDLAQSVARLLPLGGLGGDLLGLGTQRFLALGVLVAGALLLLPGVRGGFLGMFGDGPQALRQRLDVADDGGGGQRFGEADRLGLGLAGIGARG